MIVFVSWAVSGHSSTYVLKVMIGAAECELYPLGAIDLATGEIRPVYNTASDPGGALHAACGNRRESRCPACPWL
jgi:hypothetical protein